MKDTTIFRPVIAFNKGAYSYNLEYTRVDEDMQEQIRQTENVLLGLLLVILILCVVWLTMSRRISLIRDSVQAVRDQVLKIEKSNTKIDVEAEQKRFEAEEGYMPPREPINIQVNSFHGTPVFVCKDGTRGYIQASDNECVYFDANDIICLRYHMDNIRKNYQKKQIKAITDKL